MSSISGINIAGLASGIDTESIIAGLTTINARRVQVLQARKDEIAQKQAVFTDLRTKLLDLQDRVGRLARSVAGAFDGARAVSSDADSLAAAASANAPSGEYVLTVQSLAAAHQLASEGFADPGTNIRQGTLTLKVGSGPATTITIGPSNNTLQGLADAINAAGGEVRASIINDGSASPYRLLLTATRTGAANTIQVTNDLTSGSGATIDPASSVVRAAADAQITVGSGAGAVTATSATNRFDQLLPGVTLDAKRADPTRPITISVSADATAAGDAMTAFVDAYNAVIDFVNARSGFNSQTGSAGVLLGNPDTAGLIRDLALAIGASVPSVNPALNRLSTVGLKFDDKGRLQFDRSKLEDIFRGAVSGVGPADVKRLFALTGASTAPGVRFILGGQKTQPSGSTPYQVDVTQAATRGAATGSMDLAETTVIDLTNNEFTVTIDGKTSANLSLAAGSYTRAELAAAVQAAIHSDASLGNLRVIVDLDGDRLRLTSQSYGSTSRVAIGTGSAVTSGVLGFAGTESGNGQNVAGTFLVNGVVETATGAGQLLFGNSGNAHTDGLQVQVTLSPDQVVDGPDADLTVTRGLADSLSKVLARYLDPATGRLRTADKQFNDQLADFDQAIARQNELLESKKESLLKQFAAMESAVNRLNTLGLQLSLQFTVPTNNNSNRRT